MDESAGTVRQDSLQAGSPDCSTPSLYWTALYILAVGNGPDDDLPPGHWTGLWT